MNYKDIRLLFAIIGSLSALSLAFQVGKWWGHSDCRIYCDRVLVFENNYARFASAVSEISAIKVEGKYPVPKNLQSIGVSRILLDNRIMQFYLEKPLPDNGDEIILYPLDDNGMFINKFMMLKQNSTTFHIQYLSKPNWYFWKRN